MKKSYRIFAAALLALWIIPIAVTLCTGLMQAAQVRKNSKNADAIVGIDMVTQIDQTAGVSYVYFGRPSCPDCLEFEPYLEQALQKNGWRIYYFDTAYWKDDAQYERALNRYHVDSVPLLVKTVNGEFDGAWSYEGQDQETVLQELDSFFIPHYTGLLAVASQEDTMPNYPIQFHDKLMAFSFLGMLLNAVYLAYCCLRRKRGKTGPAVLPTALNATVLILLHFLIAGLGASFALQYNASPDNSILGVIGRATWLTGTPVLYAGLLLACAVIGIKNKSAQENPDQQKSLPDQNP